MVDLTTHHTSSSGGDQEKEDWDGKSGLWSTESFFLNIIIIDVVNNFINDEDDQCSQSEFEYKRNVPSTSEYRLLIE